MVRQPSPDGVPRTRPGFETCSPMRSPRAASSNAMDASLKERSLSRMVWLEASAMPIADESIDDERPLVPCGISTPSTMMATWRERDEWNEVSSFDEARQGSLQIPDDAERLRTLHTNSPAQLLGGDPFQAPAWTISCSLGRTLAQQRRSARSTLGCAAGCFMAPAGLCHV
eukprot:TRINITY_DN18691_c0_g1_i1.p2 TRINITY_DN18691_c0_g1~~TRINITY_DN18691_c0_g1_i1.p2  ORF type:complete len:171 (+),score=19.51 TRINITY_DN18691_c0_g1_i1:49-561(+)